MNRSLSHADKLLAHFPNLSTLDSEATRILNDGLEYMKAKRGTVMFAEGRECSGYVLLLSGQVKVQKISEQGREIILYRVEEGESCIMTTNCMLTNKLYNAQGIAEEDIELAIIPQHCFNQLLGLSEIFRNFVFSVYAERMSTLMLLIEEIVFKKLDQRLAKLLVEKGAEEANGEISATHQELATELGSVREVVSRQMKNFERQGLIMLSRGKIKLLQAQQLSEYSN